MSRSKLEWTGGWHQAGRVSSVKSVDLTLQVLWTPDLPQLS